MEQEVTRHIHLAGYTLEFPFLVSPEMLPVVTLYFRTGDRIPEENFQLRFLLNDQKVTDEWQDPVHGFLAPDQWDKNEIYYESHRLKISQTAETMIKLGLQVRRQDGSLFSIPFGSVEINAQKMGEWMDGETACFAQDIAQNNITSLSHRIWKWNELDSQVRGLKDPFLHTLIEERQKSILSLFKNHLQTIIRNQEWEKALGQWDLLGRFTYGKKILQKEEARVHAHFLEKADKEYQAGDILHLT